MATLPTSEYVEIREGGYYVAGTRVGLDILVHDFRAGKSPEAILGSYPSIGTLAKVYGAVTFILEHPEAVESYLRDQEVLWKEIRQSHPLPAEMQERFRRAQEDRAPQSA
jgi:uncharacterized protein (DUF433 family)